MKTKGNKVPKPPPEKPVAKGPELLEAVAGTLAVPPADAGKVLERDVYWTERDLCQTAMKSNMYFQTADAVSAGQWCADFIKAFRDRMRAAAFPEAQPEQPKDATALADTQAEPGNTDEKKAEDF